MTCIECSRATYTPALYSQEYTALRKYMGHWNREMSYFNILVSIYDKTKKSSFVLTSYCAS